MSTKIEWTDETWNPVTGCAKVSQGCKNCYAERLAPKVFAGQRVPDRLDRDYPDFREKNGDVVGSRPLAEVQAQRTKAMFFPGIDYAFTKVGKKAAGRLLDGREHSEYPA